jgi:hypothetical protein
MSDFRRGTDRDSQRPDELAALHARRAELERELSRLAGAIAQMGHSPVLLSTIPTRELELNQITEEAASRASLAVDRLPGQRARFCCWRFNDLVGLLNTYIARARA